MFVSTFYSYKGGVGRTSALMNVAHRLANRGKKVFILDFDLEAPGIDSFQPSHLTTPRSGIVEYIAHFMDKGEVASLDTFTQDISPEDVSGQIMMMPAGRKDAAYQNSLSQLDWKVLYKQKSGFLFVENLKAAIKNTYAPDYVLVDSRTGLTDVSGICTLQLPDLVVLMFSLNNQNVRGIAQVYGSIKRNKLNRPISILLVASPIPDVPESVTVRRERFENARKSIGAAPDLILPYDAFMAFQETIASESQSQALIKGYDDLTTAIIASNPYDILTLLKEARKWTAAGNTELAELKYGEIVDTQPDSWEAWTELGILHKTIGRLEEALADFQRAASLAPSSSQVLFQLSSTALALDRLEEATEYADRLVRVDNDYEELKQLGMLFEAKHLTDVAYRVLKKAADVSPATEDVFHEYAQIAVSLGHYEEAYDLYRKALARGSSKLVNVFNAAYVGKKLNRPEANDLFLRAIELWEREDHSLQSAVRNANGASAIALAYDAVNRPVKAVAELRRAKQLATSLADIRIFSVWSYRYIPKAEFLKKVDEQIALIASEHKELTQSDLESVHTTITILKSKGKFVLQLKADKGSSTRMMQDIQEVCSFLRKAGINEKALSHYAELLSRSHAVQMSADIDHETLAKL